MVVLFQGFLRELESYRMDNEVLGCSPPLMADHMFRRSAIT